jgi:hypothetical protein
MNTPTSIGLWRPTQMSMASVTSNAQLCLHECRADSFRIEEHAAVKELQSYDQRLFARGPVIEGDKLHAAKTTNSRFRLPKLVAQVPVRPVTSLPANANLEPDSAVRVRIFAG